jgi:hypothetical protein
MAAKLADLEIIVNVISELATSEVGLPFSCGVQYTGSGHQHRSGAAHLLVPMAGRRVIMLWLRGYRKMCMVKHFA